MFMVKISNLFGFSAGARGCRQYRCCCGRCGERAIRVVRCADNFPSHDRDFAGGRYTKIAVENKNLKFVWVVLGFAHAIWVCGGVKMKVD